MIEKKDAPEGFTFRRCQVVLNKSTTEDVAVNTFDFVNITSGDPDSSWITADYQAVEARLRTFYAALAAYLPSTVSLREFRWHLLPDPAEDTDAVRIAPPSTPLSFTATASMPHQVACSITKVTSSRRHWGRFYLGPMSAALLNADGHLNSSNVDSIAAAANTLRAGLQADDFPMVVYDKARQQLFTVDGIRVDNTLDIQRRRRQETGVYRKVLP